MTKQPNVVTSDKQPLVTQSAESEDPATYWRNRPKSMLRRIPTPIWRIRKDQNLPLLTSTTSVDMGGVLDFPGPGPEGTMDTFAFETRPGSAVKYVGVASLPGKVPDAILIYFRHTVQDKDFHDENTLLETGVGDYFVGRMQVCRQVLRSKKNIAVVIPICMGGAGEFASNVAFVEQSLADITRELFPSLNRPLPLLLADNSDGIKPLNDFLTNCRNFIPRIKAIYDFDGSLVIAARGVSLMGIGNARVFRYRQSSPGAAGDSRQIYLPYDRWKRHFNFVPQWQADLADKKTSPALRISTAKHVQDFLHGLIPTCMLQHGLANTDL